MEREGKEGKGRMEAERGRGKEERIEGRIIEGEEGIVEVGIILV